LSALAWIDENRFHAECKEYAVGDHVLWFMWQGFNYVVANSSRVTSDSITVHASSYIALSELDSCQ